MTGDGPKAIFDGAVAWLRSRQALLPGITTLERMIGEGRQGADLRLWKQLGDQLTATTAGALLTLLEIPEGTKQRVSELDRLRKGGCSGRRRRGCSPRWAGWRICNHSVLPSWI